MVLSMSEDVIVVSGTQRRPKNFLSPEQKWEIFLLLTREEMTAAEAARKWQVDLSVIQKIRRDAKNAGLAAFTARPGRKARSVEQQRIDELEHENTRLGETIKKMAIERALDLGKDSWG